MSEEKVTKRILIDGRFIGVGDSIARYTLEILRGILRLDTDSAEYTLLIRPVGLDVVKKIFTVEPISKSEFLISNQIPISKSKNSNIENSLKIKNCKLKILDVPHYSIAEQTTLLSYLNKEKFDLVHFTQFNHPIFYRGKFIVTIHDLILLKSGQNPIKKLFFNLVMRDAIKKSQQIISVSETTKKDIIQIYGADPEKIETIYHGIDHDKFNSEVISHKSKLQVVTDKYKIYNDYLLYVGAWKSHKNLMRLLQAFEKIKQSAINNQQLTNLQLVLVGKIDHDEPEIVEKIEAINNQPCSDNRVLRPVVMTGPVDINSDELPALYAGAKAYVIPSLLEGFGWPPLEAMACGTPVIASETSCIPEILGDAAEYFNPLGVNEMSKKIVEVLTDKNLQEELSEKGLKQSAKYTWDKTVQKTLAVYQSVLK